MQENLLTQIKEIAGLSKPFSFLDTAYRDLNNLIKKYQNNRLRLLIIGDRQTGKRDLAARLQEDTKSAVLEMVIAMNIPQVAEPEYELFLEHLEECDFVCYTVDANQGLTMSALQNIRKIHSLNIPIIFTLTKSETKPIGLDALKTHIRTKYNQYFIDIVEISSKNVSLLLEKLENLAEKKSEVLQNRMKFDLHNQLQHLSSLVNLRIDAHAPNSDAGKNIRDLKLALDSNDRKVKNVINDLFLRTEEIQLQTGRNFETRMLEKKDALVENALKHPDVLRERFVKDVSDCAEMVLNESYYPNLKIIINDINAEIKKITKNDAANGIDSNIQVNVDLSKNLSAKGVTMLRNLTEFLGQAQTNAAQDRIRRNDKDNDLEIWIMLAKEGVKLLTKSRIKKQINASIAEVRSNFQAELRTYTEQVKSNVVLEIDNQFFTLKASVQNTLQELESLRKQDLAAFKDEISALKNLHNTIQDTMNIFNFQLPKKN